MINNRISLVDETPPIKQSSNTNQPTGIIKSPLGLPPIVWIGGAVLLLILFNNKK